MVERYSGIFFGDGRADPTGIKIALEAEQIPIEMRKELIEKTILFVNTAITTSRGK